MGGGRLSTWRFVSVVGIACGACLALPVSSLAARHVTVAWQFAAGGATANQPINFTWKTTAPVGDTVVVQRPVGTAKVWRTLVKLSGRSGSGTLPGVPLGIYTYRVAVLGRKSNSRVLVASSNETVDVYGNVTLGQLLGVTQSQVYTGPSSSFPYVQATPIGGPPATLFSVAKNPCRSVSLNYVFGTGFDANWAGEAGDTASMSVNRQTQDPAVATVQYNVPGTLTAMLIPGQTWSVIMTPGAQNTWPYGQPPAIYLNGSASCDSAQAVSKSS